MATRIHVPGPLKESIRIRLAESSGEIEAANRLVFRNYVKDGFWEDDENQLRNNRFLNSPHRSTFVAMQDRMLVGTLSIIADSPSGLPSDKTQTQPMQILRSADQPMAEISAFAMDHASCSSKSAFLFLISYMFQYSFYYAGIDRLVASCKPAHADFYESNLCFSKVTDLTYYDYSRASGYLISLDLLDAHRLFSERYPIRQMGDQGVYRFLLRDPQLCHQFPAVALKRRRNIDWVERSARKVA